MLINKEKNKEKLWITKSTAENGCETDVRSISSKLGINPIIAKLLYNRGYKDFSTAQSFLKMEKEMLLNPFDIIDIEKGVERIISALKNKERITVYGDYDVDGVTSVCTLYLYLKSLGAEVDYHIPNRSGEGYGVSCAAIDMIKERGTSLIITVDTGITATNEVSYAKSIDIDFLITDHHECRAELPEAAAVINPHRSDCTYSFKELAGVGVVFKLICALEERISGNDRLTSTIKILNDYADLVAIGTIADVMPIVEENRIIVKYGLNMINKSARVGLCALIDASSGKQEYRKSDRFVRKKKKVKITSSFIGFTLAPRINAAGRVRSATIAVELFLAEEYEEAIKIAEMLCDANRERQAEENSIMKEAYSKIESLDLDANPVIVLDADDWHHGVIGIVSSRITEKYCRPSILVSFEGNSSELATPEDVGKGSGRSIKGLNLVDGLCYCQDLLVKFGGHELAAGLSVTRENLPAFREKINEFALNNLKEDDMIPIIETDCEINFKDISIALAEELQLLEPYGVGNPVPMFIMRGVNVNEIGGVSENKHTKITLGDGKTSHQAMFFSNSPDSLGIFAGDKVDVLFSIDINEWQDRKNVQLIIRDIKVSISKQEMTQKSKSRFEEIKAGATFSESENIVPDRRDFAAVYTHIQNMLYQGQNTASIKTLLAKLNNHQDYEINFPKLKFIFMVFIEMNLVVIDEISEDVFRFEIKYTSSKSDLNKSSILKKLRSQIR